MHVEPIDTTVNTENLRGSENNLPFPQLEKESYNQLSTKPSPKSKLFPRFFVVASEDDVPILQQPDSSAQRIRTVRKVT